MDANENHNNKINEIVKPDESALDFAGAPIEILFREFNTTIKGLSEKKAKELLEKYGYD